MQTTPITHETDQELWLGLTILACVKRVLEEEEKADQQGLPPFLEMNPEYTIPRETYLRGLRAVRDQVISSLIDLQEQRNDAKLRR